MNDFRVKVLHVLQNSLCHVLAMGFVLLFPVFMSDWSASAQSADQQGGAMTVNGIVTDESGVPLVGVYVFVENTTNGVSTNLDGEYSIEVTG